MAVDYTLREVTLGGHEGHPAIALSRSAAKSEFGFASP